MAAERLSSSFVKLNLSAIKKSDQFVVNIVDTASQVALYKFNGETQAWVGRTELIPSKKIEALACVLRFIFTLDICLSHGLVYLSCNREVLEIAGSNVLF